MAKQKKKTVTEDKTENANVGGVESGEGATKSKSRQVTPRAKGKKAAPLKHEARQGRAMENSGGTDPSDEEIRIRAYFISERRMRLALTGDSATDWLEARRQLTHDH